MLDSPRSSVLGPVDTAPYYALKVEASALGTVGGPRTDAHGRALNTDGNVIPGLYAAGNAGGAPTKGFYGGAGGTISLGLVFGYLAGLEAARQKEDATQRSTQPDHRYPTSTAKLGGRGRPTCHARQAAVSAWSCAMAHGPRVRTSVLRSHGCCGAWHLGGPPRLPGWSGTRALSFGTPS